MESITLYEGLANRIVGRKVENGRGILTNTHFSYRKHSLLKILLIGLFANLTKGDVKMVIPLNTIKNISQGKHGLSKSILVIETHEGEEHKFAVAKFPEWEKAFNSALASQQ